MHILSAYCTLEAIKDFINIKLRECYIYLLALLAAHLVGLLPYINNLVIGIFTTKKVDLVRLDILLSTYANARQYFPYGLRCY